MYRLLCHTIFDTRDWIPDCQVMCSGSLRSWINLKPISTLFGCTYEMLHSVYSGWDGDRSTGPGDSGVEILLSNPIAVIRLQPVIATRRPKIWMLHLCRILGRNSSSLCQAATGVLKCNNAKTGNIRNYRFTITCSISSECVGFHLFHLSQNIHEQKCRARHQTACIIRFMCKYCGIVLKLEFYEISCVVASIAIEY